MGEIESNIYERIYGSNLLDLVAEEVKNVSEITYMLKDAQSEDGSYPALQDAISDLSEERKKLMLGIEEKLLLANLVAKIEARKNSPSYSKMITIMYLSYLGAIVADNELIEDTESMKLQVLSMQPRVPVIFDLSTQPVGAVIAKEPVFNLEPCSSAEWEEDDSGISFIGSVSLQKAFARPRLKFSVAELGEMLVGSEAINFYFEELIEEEEQSEIDDLLIDVLPLRKMYIPGDDPNDSLTGKIDFAKIS